MSTKVTRTGNLLEIVVTYPSSQRRLLVPLNEIRSITAEDVDPSGFLAIGTDSVTHEISFLTSAEAEPKQVWVLYEKVRRAWSRWYAATADEGSSTMELGKIEVPRFREA